MGGGIGLKELLLILDGAIIFIIIAFIATNPSGGIIEPIYDIYNKVFFEGVNLENKESCGAVSNFFPEEEQVTETTPTDEGYFSFLNNAVNTASDLGTFVFNLFGFLANLISTCGLDMVRLTFGWGIILMNLMYIFKFVNSGREALNP